MYLSIKKQRKFKKTIVKQQYVWYNNRIKNSKLLREGGNPLLNLDWRTYGGQKNKHRLESEICG